jgi:hypothetical protein
VTQRRCFYMPLLREGDLLFNAVVLQKRLVDGTTKSQAIEAVRGSIAGSARDLFGHNVTEISRHLLGDSGHAQRLLHEHTLFGVFRHALSDAMVMSWANELKAGRHLSSLQTLGASPSDLGALSAPSLRSCPECIEADRERQGFSAWRVVHQVAAIDRCAEHGVPLDSEGSPIGGSHARIWPLKFPGERKDVRANRLVLRPSDGYAAYLRLWQKIFTNELDWLKPSAWIQTMQAAVSAFGGVGKAAEVIGRDVENAWGLRLQEISSALFLEDPNNTVREELTLRSRPKHIARRMLLHGAIDRLGLELFGFTEGVQREMAFCKREGVQSPIQVSPTITRLIELADCAGLPLASVRLGSLPGGFTNVSGIIGVPYDALRTFAAALHVGMLRELSSISELGPESWVSLELERRSTIANSRQSG